MQVNLGNLCIEPLNDLHRRGAFRCQDRGIQNYCRGRLADQHRRSVIRAYVARDSTSPDVLGFYYILNTSVEPDKLGPQGGALHLVGLDRIPAVYLGMIGVHQPVMRNGIGKQMMLHVFRQVSNLAKISGVWALTLDAIDDDAVLYYEQFDFKRFAEGGREMYLPLGTIQRAMEEMDVP